MAVDGSVTIGIEADSSEFDSVMGDVANEAERSASEMENAFQSAVTEIQGFFQGFGEGFSESFAESFRQAQEESEKTTESTRQTSKAIEDFKEGLTKKLAATVFDAVVSALKEIENVMKSLITETAAFGDTIDKNSQRLGMTTEQYQEWSYILSQNGADISTLTTSVRTINNRIDEMAQGSKTATDAFHRLGISIEDLQGKSGEESLTLIIQRLQGMEDETERNAVANDLLGRSYVDLIPLLNQSADSVEDLRQKAHDTNQLLSEEGIEAAVNYTDAVDTLSKSFNGFKTQIGSDILPGITLIVEGITDLLNNTEGAEKKIEQGIEDTFKAIERVVPRVATVLGRLANAAGEKAPEIIQRILKAIVENSPKVAEGIAKLLPIIVQAIKDLLPDIGKASGAIVSTILTAILDTLSNPEVTDGLIQAFARMGYNLCAGVANGIVDYDWASLLSTFLSKIQGILYEADKEFKYFIDSTFFGGKVYGYDKSKVQTSDWFQAYEDGADTIVKYVEIKSDELRKAYADGSAVLNELINGVEETAEETAEVVEETGEEVAEAQAEAGETVTQAIVEEVNALDKALEDLEHRYKTHKITEEEYWEQKLAILNQYKNTEDEAWWEMYDEIIAHYDKLAETTRTAMEKEAVKEKAAILKRQKELEQARTNAQKALQKAEDETYQATQTQLTKNLNSTKKSFDELVKAYDKGYNDIIKQRDAYKQKLMGGSVFEVLLKTDEKTGEQYTQYTINNLKDRLKTQTEYASQMAKLQSKRLADGLLSELEGMDTETALIFAKQLNKMSDAEFNELNAAYKQLDEETSKLADDKYSKRLETLKTNFVDQATALFEGMDADLKTLGADGAMEYIKAFTAGFEGTNLDEIKSQIDGLFTGLVNSIKDGSADISGIVEDAFMIDDAGNLMVDNIVTALRAGAADITYIMQKAVDDVDLKKIEDFISDMEARAAAQSSAGYNLAGRTAGATGIQQEPLTVPKSIVIDDAALKRRTAAVPQTTAETTTTIPERKQRDVPPQKITIDANLKLTDKAGQIIAEVVNTYNKKIEVGVGS